MTRLSLTPQTISTARPCRPLLALVLFFLVVPPTPPRVILYARKQHLHHRPPRPARTRSAPAHYHWSAKSANSTGTSSARRSSYH
ncbi:hypothetical protein K438DRAFT_1864682 [Mycena galopus ATCC 62051]|nr:hypothetical protein K438DRAFT_1864682 [Mycena galopus ATCC 62051]